MPMEQASYETSGPAPASGKQDEIAIAESVLPEGARVERETARAERGVGGGVADRWRGAGDYYYEITDEGVKVTGGDRAKTLRGGKSTVLRWSDTDPKTMQMIQNILASRTDKDSELGSTYKPPTDWDEKRNRVAGAAFPPEDQGTVSSSAELEYPEWMGPEGMLAGYISKGQGKPMEPFSKSVSPVEGVPAFPEFMHMWRSNAKKYGLPDPSEEESREAWKQVVSSVRDSRLESGTYEPKWFGPEREVWGYVSQGEGKPAARLMKEDAPKAPPGQRTYSDWKHWMRSYAAEKGWKDPDEDTLIRQYREGAYREDY